MTHLSTIDRVLLRRRHDRRRLRLQLFVAGALGLVLMLMLLSHDPQGGRWPILLPSSSSETTSSGNVSLLNNRNWSQIKERLCPNSIPQVDFADLLFELAGKEILNDQNASNSSNTEKNEKRIQQFFSGPFDRGTKLCRSGNDFVLYMRIYKCANNQITEWMNDVLDDCHSKTDLEESLELWRKDQQDDPSSLCIITAIRDPISHFLSGYNEVEYQWLANYSNFADPKSRQKILHNKDLTYIHKTAGSKERFSQFVADFLFHPKAMTQGAYDHLDLMSRILPTLQEQELALTAYLPSLHNLTHAWPQFVQSECLSNHHDALTEMDLSAQHHSSKDPFGTHQAAEDVWRKQGLIARALCILHAMDYACWEQLPEGIPEFCQEHVYATESFVDAILDMPRSSNQFSQ